MENFNKLSYSKESLDTNNLLSMIYNFEYPIYVTRQFYSNTKKRIITRTFYANGMEELNKIANSFHKNIYISVATKIPSYTEKGRARNTENNTASIGYFVVDIDSDYCLDRSLADKIINTFFLNNFFDTCPKPTAIVKSGGGLHFYYAIEKELFIGKSKNKEYFLSQYQIAVETIRNKVHYTLINFKKEISDTYFGKKDFIFRNLRVDPALCGSPNQMIRLIGSYNYEADENVELIYFNEKETYMLGNLITEYHPRYENLEYEFQDNILPYNEYKKVQKKKQIKPEEVAKSAITLNQQRLIGINKLIDIRKQTKIEGTRQKIMCQAAWCLLNINYNTKKTSEELDVIEELTQYGEKIGGYFAKKSFIKSKVRLMERYHKKRNRLSNETIIKWLEISEFELEQIPEFWPSKDKTRNKKKEEKNLKKQKAYNLWKKGEKQKNIAKEVEISRSTVKRWVKGWKNKVVEIM